MNVNIAGLGLTEGWYPRAPLWSPCWYPRAPPSVGPGVTFTALFLSQKLTKIYHYHISIKNKKTPISYRYSYRSHIFSNIRLVIWPQRPSFPHRPVLQDIHVTEIHLQFERFVRQHIKAMTHIGILEEPYHNQIFLHDFRPKLSTVYKYELHFSFTAYKAGYTFYNPYTDDHAPYFEPTRGTKQGFNKRCRRHPPTRQMAETKFKDVPTDPILYVQEPLHTPSQHIITLSLIIVRVREMHLYKYSQC